MNIKVERRCIKLEPTLSDRRRLFALSSFAQASTRCLNPPFGLDIIPWKLDTETAIVVESPKLPRHPGWQRGTAYPPKYTT